METLFVKQDRLLANTSTSIIRKLMDEINWDARLISIQGPRGVGKTTLMKQYIKKHYPAYTREALYCSLDSVYFSSHSLLQLAETFCINGGKHLFLDEVHKYPDWSKEIKEIYDLYPEIKVVFSGSSLLQLLNGDADLSRRCIPYTMQGLSFREFMLFYKRTNLPICTLEELLHNPADICQEVNKKCRPVPNFKEYLKVGYYPFYMENRSDYHTSVEQVVNMVLEIEMPELCRVDIGNVRKLKALMEVLSSSVPFTVDATKMARLIGINRNTVVEYLYHLGKSKLLNLLFSDLINVKKMQKPDKIYLENSNMLYALSSRPVDIGTARETFAVNQLSFGHKVEYGKKNGDFKVDGKYIFEVGGSGKTYDQIPDIPNSYILADDIETPYRSKLPLWAIGFAY